ncbi:MAG: methyltransferase domain-containing protein, partial [bacterium]
EINPSNLLEIGPHDIPLTDNSDTLDINNKNNPTYHHDAKITPYPIEDKKYDLVVATQVWEHLGNCQLNAFKEVQRISKNAIFSFPYKWTHSNKHHNNITKEVIGEWTDNYPPEKIIIMPNDSEKIKIKRIIYQFKF